MKARCLIYEKIKLMVVLSAFYILLIILCFARKKACIKINSFKDVELSININ